MSRKERDRLVVLKRVKEKRVKLVEAAGVLSISYRRNGCGRMYGW